MEHVQIKVTNRVGEHVGSFDQNGFEKWQHDMQREMQREMGGRIGIAIGDNCLIDCPNLMSCLPPGLHQAVLVQKIPIPQQARSKLRGWDLRKRV